MPYTNEIRECFAGLRKGKAVKLSIKEPYTAWALKMQDWYGVAVECGDIAPVCLRFSNSTLKTTTLQISGKPHSVLLFYTGVEAYRNEFATVCAQFVNPGEDGSLRRDLISNPVEWWDRWRSLLGNRVVDPSAYSTLGELLAYEALLKKKADPVWDGPLGATHDITAEDADYEVKSTTKRYETEAVLTNQFQMMNHGKKLYLLFFRFEESLHGDSIDTVAARLVKLGTNAEELEKKLKSLGFEQGSYSRMDTYHCLEMRKYTVDEHFPAITEQSFAGGKFPDSLIRFNYTVSLEGLDYTTEI